MPDINLYESSILRKVTGAAIRPGGVELTDRGISGCRLSRGDHVLDIGCGAGASVAYLRRRYGMATVGLDLSAALLAEGAQSPGGSALVQARAEQVPFADDCFAAVLCECMLSLCQDPGAVLQEIRRVLRPGGYLILADVYARLPESGAWTPRMPVRSCLQGAVDCPTVKGRIAAAGLELQLWEDHTPLLRQLAARLVWDYGSLDAFWSALGVSGAARAMHRGDNMACGRPGYYLAAAQKPESKAGSGGPHG